MKFRLCSLVFAGIFMVGSAVASDSDPCREVKAWKKKVCQFTESKLHHVAWGSNHSKHIFILSSMLAEKEEMAVDGDVLFAAAMLHDVGAFPEFQSRENPTMDHALRCDQIIAGILKPMGFPMKKIDRVKSAMLHHMFYDTVAPTTPEGIVLHNADVLDFIGAIGIARTFLIVGTKLPNMAAAFSSLNSLSDSIGSKLVGPEGSYTQLLGRQRAQETKDFLKDLSEDKAQKILWLLESIRFEHLLDE